MNNDIKIRYSKHIDFPKKGYPEYLYLDTTTNKIYYWDGISYVEACDMDMIEWGRIYNDETFFGFKNRVYELKDLIIDLEED